MAKKTKSASSASKTKTTKAASKSSSKKKAVKKSTQTKSKKTTTKPKTSKAAVKAAPKKKVVETAKKTEEKQVAQNLPKPPTFSEIFNKKTTTIFLVVLLLGLLYSFRGLFIAAMVNGKPITRLKIMTEAEKMQGTQVLDNLVMESLIEQKAREKGVQISAEAIEDQINQIRQDVTDQGQDFDQLLAFQGFTMDELRHQIRLQQIVETLVSADIEVTEEEIDQYIEDNQDFLPEEMEEEELRELVVDQLSQQKLSENYQQWSEGLRNEAKIEYFGQYVQEDEQLML